MSQELLEIARAVTGATGILVGKGDLPALAAAVARLGSGISSFAATLRQPQSRRGAVARLLDEYTVKETSFFRDRSQLEAIDWPGLLEGARADGRSAVRVWSAGCATGEEAYTLGILAAEALGSVSHVTIVATDVSGAAVRHAAAGRYRPRLHVQVDQSKREHWGFRDGEAYVLRDELRDRIEFAEHNLVHDPVHPGGPGLFDLIVCRNVLIYFASETAMTVSTALERALAPAGELMFGAADALCLISPSLAALAAALPASGAGGRKLASRRSRAGAGGVRVATAVATPKLAEPTFGPLPVDAADARGLYVRGLAALERGEAGAAIPILRRALYAEPGFALPALALARAYERTHQPAAARRAYAQAMRALPESRPTGRSAGERG